MNQTKSNAPASPVTTTPAQSAPPAGLRTALIAAFVALAALLPAGEAVFADSPAATSKPAVAEIDPAKTPGLAVERWLHSMTANDEAAYHAIVLIVSPHRYSESYSRMTFAGYRLHEAVQKHQVKGERKLESGWDRNFTLANEIERPPDPASWEAVRDVIRGVKWKVVGDVAEPIDGPPFLPDVAGSKVQVLRVQGGWAVAIFDPVRKATPDQLKKYSSLWLAQTQALDAATAKVNAGELTTILQVNDFVEAERVRIQAAETGK